MPTSGLIRRPGLPRPSHSAPHALVRSKCQSIIFGGMGDERCSGRPGYRCIKHFDLRVELAPKLVNFILEKELLNSRKNGTLITIKLLGGIGCEEAEDEEEKEKGRRRRKGGGGEREEEEKRRSNTKRRQGVGWKEEEDEKKEEKGGGGRRNKGSKGR